LRPVIRRFFRGGTSPAGAELWSIDHPSGEAALVRDIRPGPASSELRYAGTIGETIVFHANDGAGGLEFWKSDGTTAGTNLLKEITPGTQDAPLSFNPQHVDGSLFFMANDGVSGYELWRSDGTTGGTLKLKDLAPGPEHASVRPANPFVSVGSAHFFTSYSPSTGALLWRTDGTTHNTIDVTQWITSKGGSSAEIMGAVNSTLYLSVYDSTRGRELWKSDGTAAGTSFLKSIMPGVEGSYPSAGIDLGGFLYFAAYDAGGRELWRSDGTPAGTVRVRDIEPGAESSHPADMTEVNGTLYFTAQDAVHGRELWKVAPGESPVLVKDVFPGSGHSAPKRLENIGGVLYFRANDGTTGYELWRSDGTAIGTTLVKDIRPGIEDGLRQTYHQIDPFFATVDDELYFLANDGVHGYELWKSDGTSAGTVMVKEIVLGPEGMMFENSGNSNKSLMANVNGVVYFAASDGNHGVDLWKSDGTVEGTTRERQFGPGGIRMVSEFQGKPLLESRTSEFGLELYFVVEKLNGDYDANQQVDGADFLAWQRQYGSTAAPAGSGADGDGNGIVGDLDLAVWRTSFGTTSLAPAATAESSASEFAVAALAASEEISPSARHASSHDLLNVDAADAAFAWLARDRAATGDASPRQAALAHDALLRERAASRERSAPERHAAAGGRSEQGAMAERRFPASVAWSAAALPNGADESAGQGLDGRARRLGRALE
jgi:ELWxxDGT repeat protein